ncbi:hypothetical protein Tco_0173591 [Tanacetum coccineum]
MNTLTKIFITLTIFMTLVITLSSTPTQETAFSINDNEEDMLASDSRSWGFEVPNPWYKSQLFELFLTLNPEERQHYQGRLTAKMRVASLEQKLQNAQTEMEMQQENMQMQQENMDLELLKAKKMEAFGSSVLS